ncbi:transglutaminase family protein [uncultured Desulfuromonas sp.]|uniref:transglutaminase family protein n=1 Tax=uncultured Desulfuromonas sp. TaxID=181013 RepID=UPI00262BB4C1|nr:transglutaminase family protein [uncultured Desulfuromonas sp.]
MRFRVHHVTRYLYSRPVFLEPHIVRLRPREDPLQRLLHFDMELLPRPVGLVQGLGPEGSPLAQAWFEGLTESLEIRTRFEAQTLCTNPFDFLLADPAVASLPASYPPALRKSLSGCLEGGGGTPEVADFARAVCREAGGGTLPFLVGLAGRIYESFRVVLRHEGPPHPPEKTLALRQGSCRDLAVLFIAACRCQGLAARFVSGYQQGDADSRERHMHAWAEVFLPGGGWRGFDPTHGMAVAEGHLALTASHEPLEASPVSGTIRGNGSEARMEYRIELAVEP